MQNQAGNRGPITFLRDRAQFPDPAEIRSRPHHAADKLHVIELKIPGAQQRGDGLPVNVITTALAAALGRNVQPLEAQVVRSERVGLDAAFNFIFVAFTGNGAGELAGAAQCRTSLQ